MSKREIKVSELEPGRRYNYTIRGNKHEGIFEKVYEDENYKLKGFPQHNVYVFRNVVDWVPDNKRYEKPKVNPVKRTNTETIKGLYSGLEPTDIHVYEFPKLPEDLNRYIQTFGGKPKKSKKNRKSIRRNKTNRKTNKK
jgi:hypothetical protein